MGECFLELRINNWSVRTKKIRKKIKHYKCLKNLYNTNQMKGVTSSDARIRSS